MNRNEIHLTDALTLLKSLNENSVDSIVTDPPYGIAFMNRKWDYDVPAVEIWVEALRVLKPGGHLLCFASTKTYHRMAVNIEDAGFEIRDMMGWMYGSGFPKNHDISKAVDRELGEKPVRIGSKLEMGIWNGRKWQSGSHPGLTREHHHNLDADAYHVFAPATEEAAKWKGWGTALKPSHEPIVMARKPISETVAKNILKYGTGGINIDDSRVGSELLPEQRAGEARLGTFERKEMVTPARQGRYPANLMHDGSEEVLELFPVTGPARRSRKDDRRVYENPDGVIYGENMGGGRNPHNSYEDEGGSAARYFYCPKASSKEREGNNHPTVKPIRLMEYLVRLVTPPGGVVLDPFAGSGSTLVAAKNLGFDFCGCEKEAAYVDIAKRRLESNDR